MLWRRKGRASGTDACTQEDNGAFWNLFTARILRADILCAGAGPDPGQREARSLS